MTCDEKLIAIRDLIQFDVGERGLARDPQCNLINACPADFANACRSIAAQPHARVGIITGFWIASADPPCGETDGPLGAVYLAHAFLHLGIGVELITDHFCVNALKEGLDAHGLRAAIVVAIPPAGHPWDAYLDNDWARNNQNRGLTHVLAIERVGPAADERCYSMRGRDITLFMSPAHLLMQHLSRHGITSIGIGDGGNEIGMGKIRAETIERNIPNGRQIACRVATDHLLVTGISNWGAYGVAAGVALLRGRQLDPVLFDPEFERRVLERMVKYGPLVDGKTAQPTATVDGVAFADYIRPLTQIQEIVEDFLR